MNTRRALLLIALLMLAFWAGAQDRSSCVEVVDDRWGDRCDQCQVYNGFRRDDSSTFQLRFRNTCRDLVEIKVAMQERGGSWRIFPTRSLVPGEQWSAYACLGTGRYLYWERRVSDEQLLLPSNVDILTEYRAR